MFLFCDRGEGGSNIKCDIVGGGGGGTKKCQKYKCQKCVRSFMDDPLVPPFLDFCVLHLSLDHVSITSKT